MDKTGITARTGLFTALGALLAACVLLAGPSAAVALRTPATSGTVNTAHGEVPVVWVLDGAVVTHACENLTYAVDVGQLDGGAQDLVAVALNISFAYLGDVTGHTFTSVDRGDADLFIEAGVLDDDHLGTTRFAAAGLNDIFDSTDFYRADYIGLDAASFNVLSTSEATRLVLHELGHFLGLGHSDDRAAVMYPTQSRTSTPQFSPAEVAALQQMYSAC